MFKKRFCWLYDELDSPNKADKAIFLAPILSGALAIYFFQTGRFDLIFSLYWPIPFASLALTTLVLSIFLTLKPTLSVNKQFAIIMILGSITFLSFSPLILFLWIITKTKLYSLIAHPLIHIFCFFTSLIIGFIGYIALVLELQNVGNGGLQIYTISALGAIVLMVLSSEVVLLVSRSFGKDKLSIEDSNAIKKDMTVITFGFIALVTLGINCFVTDNDMANGFTSALAIYTAFECMHSKWKELAKERVCF